MTWSGWDSELSCVVGDVIRFAALQDRKRNQRQCNYAVTAGGAASGTSKETASGTISAYDQRMIILNVRGSCGIG